jgi:predicted HTH domain antitoxin
MSSHGLTTALTLYRSGTITLATAAARAGLSEAEFRAALHRRGIDVRERDVDAPDVAETNRSARAD